MAPIGWISFFARNRTPQGSVVEVVIPQFMTGQVGDIRRVQHDALTDVPLNPERQVVLGRRFHVDIEAASAAWGKSSGTLQQRVQRPVVCDRRVLGRRTSAPLRSNRSSTCCKEPRLQRSQS